MTPEHIYNPNVNYGIKLLSLILRPTGIYPEQPKVTLTASLTGTSYDKLNEALSITNFDGNTHALDDISYQILTPSIDLNTNVRISNGWSTERYAFTAIFLIQGIVSEERCIVSGFTDHCELLSHSGKIDPKAILHINSYIRIISRDHISSDAYVLHSNDFGYNGGYNDVTLLTPSVVLSNLNANIIAEGAFNTSALVCNYMKPELTNLRDPKNWLTSIIDPIGRNYKGSGGDKPMTEIISLSRSQISNRTHRNPLFEYLKKYSYSQGSFNGSFEAAVLFELCYDLNDMLTIVSGKNKPNALNTSEGLSGINGVYAVQVANIISSIMADNGIMTCSFMATNKNVLSKTAIMHNAEPTALSELNIYKLGLIDVDVAASLDALFTMDIAIPYEFSIIYGSTSISINISVMENSNSIFELPAFAASITSPLLGGYDDCSSLTETMSGITDVVIDHINENSVYNHKLITSGNNTSFKEAYQNEYATTNTNYTQDIPSNVHFL